MLCPNLTFVVFTFNEQQRLPRVLENLCPLGHVLVVDNESTDDTKKIAQRFGASILINKNSGWVEDEVTTSRVKAAVETEWIYWAFADEMIDRSTAIAISDAIQSNQFDIINIARKNYFYGQFCHDAFADRMNRIFRKHAIDFTGNTIHGFGRVTVEQKRIKKLDDKHFVHHFISNTAKSYVLTMDRYTDIQASARTFATPAKLLFGTIKMVVVQYFLKGGYKAGKAGAFLTLHCAFYSWLLAMKSYEKIETLDRERIEQNNDIVRNEILERSRA